MYSLVQSKGKTYYKFFMYCNAYLPVTKNGRIQLYAATEEELDKKVKELNEKLDMERRHAVSMAGNFSELYYVYLKEYFPDKRRSFMENHIRLFSHFKEYPETKEVYIAFFQKIIRTRTKKTAEKILALMSETVSFGSHYGYKSCFPEEDIKALIRDNKDSIQPSYTKDEAEMIISEIKRKENGSFIYGDAAIILPFLVDVCLGSEEFIHSVWSDFFVENGTVYIDLVSQRKRRDVSAGTGRYVFPDELLDIVADFNKDRYPFPITKDTLKDLPDDPVFKEAHDKTLFGRRIHNALAFLALPDNIRPFQLAEEIRKSSR
jgi:hypothetical protein